MLQWLLLPAHAHWLHTAMCAANWLACPGADCVATSWAVAWLHGEHLEDEHSGKDCKRAGILRGEHAWSLPLLILGQLHRHWLPVAQHIRSGAVLLSKSFWDTS